MNEKVLKQVEALLRKAESTEYPEEAAAFTAKAQSLMVKHGIEEAMLRGLDATTAAAVTTDRLVIAGTYRKRDWQLLEAIARAHDVKTVGTENTWIRPYDIRITMLGFPEDLELVRTLFLSLRTQAHLECARGARDALGSKMSFRKNFLDAYAARLFVRMKELRDSLSADAPVDYLPVLASRRDAVQEAFEDMFKNVRSGRAGGAHGYEGLAEGRDAANRADLGATKLAGGSTKALGR